MTQQTPYIKVGKIGSSYGVKGWVKVLTYTEFGSSILEYNPWYLENKDGNWEAIEIEEGKVYGKGVIVKFATIHTPEEAKLYSNRFIGIPRNLLPQLDKNEFYWSDLQGLTVINKEGQVLGKVIYLMETGANDVLVVKGEKEHAIPYLEGKVILNVDLDKQEIQVDWEPI